ncbi:isovaleryl-CoA dehydrogenase [Mycolicibacterium fortuitum]|uniref:Isovaleryl-CoA dehydrogenase n=1 Tax=Mycolicibacterium fortuitum TaxID=1766 RepID=A0ABD6QE13_MYCFO|nr:acyl-CoA dehydrogenase family protein [Mycolicibacterium fortuitum]OMC33119.1 isovaleryl-CoA dehydrogenase [Mycolicibacterium fortuitum]
MSFTLDAEGLKLQEKALAVGRELQEDGARWDAANLAPYREVCDRMREAGLLGLTMPEEYGGQGGKALDYVIAVSSILRASQTWIGPEPLFCTSGPGVSMVLLGNEAVRKKYLPQLVRGDMGAAIALTEPDHGSDLTYLESTAVLDGDAYIVNGSKAFITGSGVNELYATFVRVDGIPGPKGIAALVIEADSPGVSSTDGPEFVGDRGIPHGDVHFDNVRVPAENLIVGAGQFGWLMSAFNMERLHNSALCLGLAEAAYDEAVAFCKSRHSFGRPIIEFQSVYHSLADMWVKLEAQRMLAYRAGATARDGRFPDAHDVTVAKLHGSKMMVDVTMASLELHGGYGVTLDYPIQRIHRDAISSVVAGGAPAVLRNSVASMIFPDHKFPQTRS